MPVLFSFFLSVFPAQIQASAQNTETPTICQFYLNKNKGEKNKQLLSQKIPKGLNVRSFHIKSDELGKEGFERMISSGVKCDGLVISGHHVGDFTDKDKRLFLKDMENLSCEKNYRNWFSQIKSLWLLGCNTVTDKYLTPVREGRNKRPNKTVDSETARLLDSSYSADEIFIFQHSYSSSIDELTPLSSRYLRMFPNTSLYGFHNSAPSDSQKSDSELIYNHIKNTANSLNLESSLTNKEKEKNSISQGLHLLLKSNDYCDERLESWESDSLHANARSIDNEDYTDVYNLGCQLIEAKKNLTQILDNPASTDSSKAAARKKITDILKKINEKDKEVVDGTGQNNDIKYSHLLFNNIYETWALARKKDSKLFNELKGIFKEDVFSEVLKERVESPIVSSVKQIDYLNFYKEIHSLDIHKNKGSKEKLYFMKNALLKINKKLEGNFKDLINIKKGSAIGDESKKMLSLITIDQLSQYNLLNKEQASTLLKNKNIFPKIKMPEDFKKMSSKDIYTLQIKYKLDHNLSNSEQISNKILKDLKNPSLTYPEKAIPVKLAVREFVKSNDLKNLNKLVKKLPRDIESKLVVNILNEIAVSLDSNYPNQPRKQSQILLNYAKKPSLRMYAFESASNLPARTGQFFFSQINPNQMPKNIRQKFKAKYKKAMEEARKKNQ